MELMAISPIDGRYKNRVKDLEGYFSEFALIRNRLRVESEYLISLSEAGIVKISKSEKAKLRRSYQKFSLKDANKIKSLEGKLNHDIKAAESFLRSLLSSKSREYIHLGLTSEDVNSIAQGLALKESIDEIYVPAMLELLKSLSEKASKHSKTPMLARTHGQAASPTTLGKELANYCFRIRNELEKLHRLKVPAKLTGATGNFNAHVIAYPKINWISFSSSFIESMGLKPHTMTTQIVSHEDTAEIFDCIRRLNSVVSDLVKNLWIYYMLGYIHIKKKEDEVGSSTMPHKINPIDFENCEGNMEIANSVLMFFSSRLSHSRLSRDLSDSTIKRNYGVGMAHSIIGAKSASAGIRKTFVNEHKISEDLREHSEVLSEAVQMILKRAGIKEGYEKVRKISRGEQVSVKQMIPILGVSKKVSSELTSLQTESYTGLASKLADSEIKKTKKFLLARNAL